MEEVSGELSQPDGKTIGEPPEVEQVDESGEPRGRRGFIPDYKRDSVPKPAREWLGRLLEGWGPHDFHLFIHLLYAGLRDRERDAWVPLHSVLLRARLRQADPLAMVEAGLLEFKPHRHNGVRYGGLSREYRVPAELRRAFLDVLHASTRPGATRVNVLSGQKTQAKEKTRAQDRHGNALPALIIEGMKGVRLSRFKDSKAAPHVAAAKRRAEEAEARVRELTGLRPSEAARLLREAHAARKRAYAVGEDPDPLPWGPDTWAAIKEAERALGRYAVDALAYDALCRQTTRHLGGGVYEYLPAYEPQSTGRITDIGGRLQSATREFKAAAWAIEGVRNYDLRNSQPRELRAAFIEAGIETQNIDRLLFDRAHGEDARKAHAQAAGVSLGAFKAAVMALVMAARLPRSFASAHDRYGDPRGDVVRIICAGVASYVHEGAQVAGGGPDEATAYARFCDLVRPLNADLQRWREWLRRVWGPANTVRGRGGRRYVRNAVGARLCIEDVEGDLGKALAAHYLQGREAAFIYTLTSLQDEYGFAVIGNEHDGLVTLGEIPGAAIEEVKRRLGMPYAELVEKPFVA